MEYQVPQFIEVEDKIFGPLSLKQFIYLAGGLGISVALVLYLHIVGFIIAAPIAALALALAFYKVNNKSFVEMLEAGFNYYLGGRLYLWKKDESPQMGPTPQAPADIATTREKLGLSQGKLHELAWSLDIKDQNAPQE
ncbi:MAG: PrgI family protein [Candidatus Pacebacteria bacterium]|nr:PrgI family protein [Candidatus Paceibacterota bacterium]